MHAHVLASRSLPSALLDHKLFSKAGIEQEVRGVDASAFFGVSMMKRLGT